MNNFKNFAQKVAQQAKTANNGAGGAGPQGGGGGIVALLGLGLGAWGLANSMVTVQPGHKGVVYNRIGGINDKIVLREGLNFVIPWFQRAIIYDIRTRPQPIDSISGSKG